MSRKDSDEIWTPVPEKFTAKLLMQYFPHAVINWTNRANLKATQGSVEKLFR